MHPRQLSSYGGKQLFPPSHSMGEPRQSSQRHFPPRQVSPGVTQQQQFLHQDTLPFPGGSQSSQSPRGYPPRPTTSTSRSPFFVFHSVDPIKRTNKLPSRGYSSPSYQHPQHRFPYPHQFPGRLTKPPQSSFSPTPRQPGFLQPNIYPQQRFSKQSSPQQINMMPSPQQMKHYSGSYRSQERFYIPSQSPRKRFNSPSFGPRSSPNLLPRDPTSNHDIRARFPPSSSSGSMSLIIF